MEASDVPATNEDGVAAGLRLAIEAAGGIPRLADALGIHRTGLWRWKRVPADHVRTIERLYGVPRAVQRPDLFCERG